MTTARLQELLTSATTQTLNDTQRRKVAALVGAAVADAATRPFHWVYSQEQLESTLAGTPNGAQEPEFWPTNQSPYYSLPTGARSCYNDECVVTMRAMHAAGGPYEFTRVMEAFKSHFGAPDSAYQRAAAVRKANNVGTGSLQKGPVLGPWIQGSVRHLLAHFASDDGADPDNPAGDPSNKEMDGFCAALPLVVLQTPVPGSPDWAAAVGRLLSQFSLKSEILAYGDAGLQLVLAYVNGDAPKTHSDALNQLVLDRDAAPEVTMAMNGVGKMFAGAIPFSKAQAHFGLACYMPGSMQGAWLASFKANSFEEGVRINIVAGGCNCSRANYIGACLGAKFGLERIPLAWMAKTEDCEEILEMAIKLVQQ